MGKRQTVAVVTGSRAEFGLLEPVMRAIKNQKGLKLKTVVAGSHLVANTWGDVERAGFVIDARVRMQKRGESGRAADAAALGRGVSGYAQVFDAMKPDVVLVLGDRIEVFAAASAAHVAGVCVAHIHGGDRAEGVADEAMRHATGKLAHVHFAATAKSAKRLIRMGELEASVHVTGSPAVDGLKEIEAVEGGPSVLVLQHPVGGSDAEEERWMRGTLEGVKRWAGELLVLGPNGDAGCVGVRRALEGTATVEHVPREQWLRVLKGARVIVGNSSAGLIEASVLGTACVNVGPRQNGREKPGSVVDCDYGARRVREAVEKALAIHAWRVRHPYGDGRSGERIAALLAATDWSAVDVRKRNAY